MDDKLEKYRGKWIWGQDTSTIFTAAVTLFAFWSICVTIEQGTDVTALLLLPILPSLGARWLPLPIAGLLIWLFVLLILKSRGKLINQKLENKDIMTTLTRSRELTEQLGKLAVSLHELAESLKDTKKSDSKLAEVLEKIEKKL